MTEGRSTSDSKPLVSVIVPSYNHAPFLTRRLDSILNQTFRDSELIVLDDCSTDNSRDILQDYANRFPMQLVLNEKNSGSPFAQWRRGAFLAKGRYLWIAESDDEADPELLETLVKVMIKHPEVGLAYCQSYRIDADNTRFNTCDYYTDNLDPKRWKSDFVNNGVNEVAQWLIQHNTVPNASAVLVRRDVFLEASEDAEHYLLCGDWRTWARVLLASDVAFVAEPLNHFRTHATSVRSSTKLGAACVEYLKVQADLCSCTTISPQIRVRALADTFSWVWRCMVAPDFVPTDDWFDELLKYGTQIHPRAGRHLAWLRFKYRVRFLRPAVRMTRSLFKAKERSARLGSCVG